nr:MAG TPA: hypothetical protein [Caudoviricetes sp.]
MQDTDDFIYSCRNFCIFFLHNFCDYRIFCIFAPC